MTHDGMPYDGALRVTLVTHARKIQGLHLCEACLEVVQRAWGAQEDAILAVSHTPWRGPCDLCRILLATIP